MGDWHVDISSPAAVRASLGDFEQQVDDGIRHARANNIVFVITLLTAIAPGPTPRSAASPTRIGA